MSINNNNLIVILRIDEGIGFFKTNNNIIAIASLGGNQIESEIITAGLTTNFNCNLIWETTRNSVKKMKDENYPIKIQFFSINLKLPKTPREFIGYLLLPIRNIKVQSPRNVLSLSAHWHKLIGLSSNWKSEKPQILLFLSITSNDIFQNSQVENIPENHQEKQEIEIKYDELNLNEEENDDGTISQNNEIGKINIECDKETESHKEVEVPDPQTFQILSVSKNIDKAPSFKQEIDQIRHTYSLNLILASIKFTRRPDFGIWQISLHHPKAEIQHTIAKIEMTETNETLIEFNNFELTLYFTSYPDKILNLIDSESCSIIVNGPRSITARAEIDNNNILNKTNINNLGTILLDNLNGETIAIAKLFIKLNDHGINFNSQSLASPKPPSSTSIATHAKPYYNENYAYKIVDELEKWKIKEKENFLNELKIKQNDILKEFSNEWNKEKLLEESRLAKKIKECAQLTIALEEAQKSIHENEFKKINELEKIHQDKLKELNEKLQKIQDDIKHKELYCKELEMSKSFLEKENLNLCERLNDYEIKLNDSFTKDQLKKFFEDLVVMHKRLEDEQKSKNFYKEKWAMLLREMHIHKERGNFMIRRDNFDYGDDNEDDDDDNKTIVNERLCFYDGWRNSSMRMQQFD